ncbi:PTS sugar transporter subunit IIB [Vibrio coralliirubri]|uniref:PTS sugar transporter subunit IIB n=1 Tax=Vibrio coralliirubri TaxID=1516159 RepID=UPI002283BDA4|nr:PTS sugar transporter subunit IIB [Vibrio coralliirubri]MCY9861304.1 PTS sugar transporter subunit IIB [Vibrio coralliirubri]
MKQILTVCGNGIGSSLMAAGKVRQICKELGVEANVESIDVANALGQNADLYVTVKAIASQFPESKKVAVIRSYVNKAQIEEDIKDILLKL